MRIGMSSVDITPRVGVDLSGFGPFLNRSSVGVKLPLRAKGIAFEIAGRMALIVNCELVGVTRTTARQACARIVDAVLGLAEQDILICATHTHSGPATGCLNGWGEPDPLYLELLPDRIAAAGIAAVKALEPAAVEFGTAPCEHIGLNREYEPDAPPLDVVLAPEWRSQCPEKTDTEVKVLKFVRPDGSLLGFAAYFGCHPVVCCQLTHWIHGDYPGVALAKLQQEFPGALGVFLQGAQGDVNSCVVHKPEAESLAALAVIGERFAASIREALRNARPIAVDTLRTVQFETVFSARPQVDTAYLEQMERDNLAKIHAPDADPESCECRMAMVHVLAARKLLAQLKTDPLRGTRATIAGIRLGPVALLASPFETMQAIKNDVVQKAHAPIPLVLGIANDSLGYAPDRYCAARGGYAADTVPIICGTLPFADIHGELAAALLRADAELAQ